MKFEVEQKYRVADEAVLIRRIAELGGTPEDARLEVDQYFTHPARNFAKTDEALRIRTREGEQFVTYKGPKIDQTTKTRREIEIPLSTEADARRDFADLLEALGFAKHAVVRKRRRKFELSWEGAEIEGALDEVESVGTFVELEILAEESAVDEAKRRLKSLAEKLGLEASERRSYLELLLKNK